MGQFEKIQTFVQIVQSGSFSKAAKKLSCSVPAVSKQLKTLEDDLNLCLLDRSTRGLALTEAGQAYFDRCTDLIQNFQDTQSFASHLEARPQGTLRVVATRHFGKKILIPHLEEFLIEYPMIKLDLELAERIPDLRAENIDLLFALSLPGQLDWIRKPFTQTRYIFCAAPIYLKKHGTPTLPVELSAHFYLNHSMRKPLTHVEFEPNLRIAVPRTLILNDAYSLLECALKGMGIVRLHEYMVQKHICLGKLIELFPDHNLPVVQVYTYYPATQFISPKVKQFIQFFHRKFKNAGSETLLKST